MRLSSLAATCMVAIGLLAATLPADYASALILVPDYTLTDGGSSVDIDPDSDLGTYNWHFNGQNHLARQWFWYRVAGDNQEYSIDTLDVPPTVGADPNPKVTGANTMVVRYVDNGGAAAPRFNMDVSFTLTGTATQSDLEESITIRNLSSTEPLTMTFFQYADFDLSGTSGDDTATIAIGLDEFNNEVFQAALQSETGSVTVSETVLTGSVKPVRFEVNDAFAIYSDLTDGDLDDLDTLINGSSTTSWGPGNAAWALQWDLVINADSSVTISKDKALTLIPEPASAVLMGLAGLMLLKRRRG